jgi:hypothetical protein
MNEKGGETMSRSNGRQLIGKLRNGADINDPTTDERLTAYLYDATGVLINPNGHQPWDVENTKKNLDRIEALMEPRKRGPERG